MAQRKPAPAYLKESPALDLGVFDAYLATAPAQATQPEGGGVMARMGDAGLSLLKGAIAVPEAAVGLADLVTGGQAGQLVEQAGFRPAEARGFLDTMYSDAQQAANREVLQAQGFLPVMGAALRNPSTIVHGAIESLPLMGGGGVVARGLMKALPGLGMAVAAGAGEGVVTAGSQAEQVRQGTADGLLTPQQAGIAAASGAATGAIGAIAGRLANRLGIGDVDQLLAGGTAGAAGAGKGFVRKVLEGALSEGVLEELPQSVQEQVAVNYALGKPLDEGVDQAAVMGMLSGGLMGGAAGPMGHGAARAGDPLREAKLPEGGPVTRAVNAAVEAEAGRVDLGLPTLTQQQADAAMGAMEAQARADEKSLRAAGRADKSGLPPLPPAPPTREGSAEVIDTPYLDRVLTLREQMADDSVRAAVRSRFGAKAFSDLAYYASAADNLALPERTRENMVAVAERIVADALLQPQPAPQGYPAPGMPVDRLPPAAEVPRIGLDLGPTGRMRVGPDGVARPETRAEAISTAQREEEARQRRTDLGQQVKPSAEVVPAPAPPAALTYQTAPTGRMLAGPQGVRVETQADRINQSQAQAERDATAQRLVATGLPPDVQRAQALRAQANPQPGDVLNPEGEPFRNEGAAKRVQKKAGGEVLKVRGGWVVRPAAVVASAPQVAPASAAPSPAAAPAAPAPTTAIEQAAHEAATSPHNDLPQPTEAQREAGNFKMGHVRVGGLDVTVEYPKGSERAGKGADGRPWRRLMRAHYGYIRRTEGADGEPIDVYVGERPGAKHVYVIDQQKADGSFDEHKVMLGYPSLDAAQRGYRAHFPRGWKVGPTRAMSLDEFKTWVKEGDKSQPAATVQEPTEPPMPSEAVPEETAAAGEAANPAEAQAHSVDGPMDGPASTGFGNDAASTAEAQDPEPRRQGRTKAAVAASVPAGPERGRLDDSGEELLRNRRNRPKGLAWEDVATLNDALKVRQVVKANIWPRPNYAELASLGAPAWKVAVLKVIYDRIAAAPATRATASDADFERYVAAVTAVRDAVLPELDRIQQAQAGLATTSDDALWRGLGEALRVAKVFSALFPIPQDGSRFHGGTFDRTTAQGRENNARALVIGGNPVTAALQFDYRTMRRARALVEEGFPAKQEAWQRTYEVVERAAAGVEEGASPSYFVHTKGVRWRAVKDQPAQGFADREQAEGFARSLSARRAPKDLPPSRGLDLAAVSRTGPDWRAGRHVSADDVRHAFGFRGVNLGEYVKADQQVAQAHLDHAYDALMDLADLIGVPPRALSLNGTLGLAIGAQGSGRALAHFVPGVNEINITKASGAGALAHEWAHALDHYFAARHSAGAARDRQPWLSVLLGRTHDRKEVRQEVWDAFKTLMQSIEQRDATQQETRDWLQRQRAQLQARLGAAADRLRAGAPDPAKFDAVVDQLKAGDIGSDEALDDIPTNLTAFMRVAGLPDGDARAARVHIDAIRLAEMRDEQRFIQAHRPQMPTDFTKASNALDSRRKEAYWGTPHEKFARAFETYVMDALQERRRQSLYLSGLVDGPAWKDWEAVTGGKAPYPSGEERVVLGHAFQALMGSLQTREDEGGKVAILSRAPGFSVAVDAALAEGADLRVHVALGRTPALLKWLGLPDKPVVTTAALLDKMHQMHGLTAAQLKTLPDLLADPVMVFRSDTRDQRFLVVTDLLSNGRPVVLVVDPEGKAGRVEVVFVPSAYPKDDLSAFARWIKAGLLEYVHKSRSRQLATTTGLQLPGVVQRAVGFNVKKYKTDADRPPGENLASRGQAPGTRAADIERAIRPIVNAWTDGPTSVTVVQSVSDLPADVQEGLKAVDAEGEARAFLNPETGRVFLIADNLADMADAQFALFHEVYGHFGLRAVLGDEYLPMMTRLRSGNTRLAAEAAHWFALYGPQEVAARVEAGMPRMEAERLVRALAVEEALADRAGMNEPVSFLRLLVGRIQRALRRIGLDQVANWLENHTEAETLDLLRRARRAVQGSDGQGHALRADPREADDTPLLSRRSPLDALRRIDQQAIRDSIADHLGDAGGHASWWDKTLGTQYAKAQKYARNPATAGFKTVFDAVQSYLEGVSTLANESADQAPGILPPLDTWRDLARRGLSDADAQAVAAPIFEGTLVDKKVYDEDELRGRFGLTPGQIDQYRAFLAAVNTSLDQAVAADVLRLVGDDAPPAFKRLAMSERAALRRAVDDLLTRRIDEAPPEARDELERLLAQVREKYARIDTLKHEGYAPLMRFGEFAVTVRDPATQEVLYFGLFENRAAANRMARELGQDETFLRRGAVVEQGVLSQEQFKLFAGVPVESLEMFAAAIGADKAEVYQQFLKLTKNNRSALKRLIHRKGTAGFSQDVPRVLAAFVTSNARLASAALNLPGASQAAEGIRAGDVKDEAVGLIETATNPRETASALRGLLFMNFIGGSIASAFVNLTQPLTMTAPYLSQWGGMGRAAARLLAAGKMAASGKVADVELRNALAKAERDGIVSPQEIHHLTAQAMGTWGTNPVLKKAAFIWGSGFSLAEQFNRRVTFLAAYQTAKAEGIDDPFGFAERAVTETQGLYNRGNAPNWARNPVGAVALTFKQFSIHYVEWLTRMWQHGPAGRRAVAWALVVLLAAAGADGLPFAEDLDDLIDTLAQALGLDFSSARAKREFVAETLGLGDDVADAFTRGLSSIPGMPIDLSLRLSMGNLIPASGLFLRSNTDRSRDVMELAGAAGSAARQGIEAGEKALQGDVAGSLRSLAPVAVQNALKGVEVWSTGEYRDTRGRKVMEADELDGLMKAMGFQPAAVARESRGIALEQRRVQLARNVEAEIADAWARGLVDEDPEAVRAAQERLAKWNADNPRSRIVVQRAQIARRARELRAGRSERFVRSAPRELRAEVERALP